MTIKDKNMKRLLNSLEEKNKKLKRHKNKELLNKQDFSLIPLQVRCK